MNHPIRSRAPISETSPFRGSRCGSESAEASRRSVAAGDAMEGGSAELRPAPCAHRPGGAAGRVLPVRGRRVRGRDVQRVRQVDRRPLVGRPGGAPPRYERVRVAPRRRPHVPAPAARVERARLGFATLAVAALAAALFVVAVLLSAHWRVGAPAPVAQERYSMTESPRLAEPGEFAAASLQSAVFW